MTKAVENSAGNPALFGKTFLVVEDEAFSRKLAVMALAKFSDCSVLEAADGEQAWDMLSKEAVDLLVLDLHLGALTGLDLLHQIRAGDLPVAPALPIVVVTGSTEPVTEQIARAMGVDAFLHKPVKAEMLRQTVIAAFEGRG